MLLEQSSICRWEAPGGAQQLISGSSIVHDLTQAAIQGFLAIPKRGVEIGGLLFGKVRREGEVHVFEVLAYDEIPCEHRFGPSYVLDASDRERLAEILTRREHEGALPVLGLYRSYTGREAKLDEADQELLRAFFPRQNIPCLLLRPLTVQKCESGVQFWDGGAMVPAPEPLVDPEPLREPETPVAETLPQSEPLQDEPPRPPRAVSWPGILTLACCLLAGMACASTYELWKVNRKPRAATVRFEAQPTANDLLLSWDPANPAVSTSTRGTLVITDGAYPFEISLSPAQIRRGKLTYSPTSESPSFHVRFYNQEREVADGALQVVRLPESRLQETRPVAHAPARLPAAAGRAPIATHEVKPDISPGIRARIAEPTKVPVMVNVDQSGHVTHAWSKITGHDGLQRYLIDEATKAAREWTFSPAQSNTGEPVPATTTISFEFTPGQ